MSGATLTSLQQGYVWPRACKCVRSVCMDLQWFPIGRCYCRNKANSLTNKGGPEEVCPSGEHKSSLRNETGKRKEVTWRRDSSLCQDSFKQFKRLTLKWVFTLLGCVVNAHSSSSCHQVFHTSPTHYESLCVREFLKEFTKILIPLFVCRTEDLKKRKENMLLYPTTNLHNSQSV